MTAASDEPGLSGQALEPASGAAGVTLSPSKRALLERRLAAGPAPPKRPPAAAKTDRLSYAQEQLWYFHALDPDNPVYNEAVRIDKAGSLDHKAFVAAFNEIVARHEAWHTTFELAAGQPVRRVVDPPWFDLPIHDLSGLGPERAESEAHELFTALALKPYDLQASPPLRPMLVRLSEDHYRLCLALHHLVFDGVSLYRILLPELVRSYQARTAGDVPSLAPPPASYGDFVAWERNLVESPEGDRRLEHWRRHLAELPVTALPIDHPRPAMQRFQGRIVPVYLSQRAGRQLHKLAAELGVTLFQLFASIFAIYLHKYSLDDEVVFAVSTDLRHRQELKSAAGFCVAPLVLRCRVDDASSLNELVESVRSELIDALDHALPFAPLVRAVRPERRLDINPLFQAMLTLETEMDMPDPDWSFHVAECDVVHNAKCDLNLELDERPDGSFDGRLILNADLFDDSSGSRMLGHFVQLVDQVCDNDQARVSELDILSQAELKLELQDWNATDAPISFGSVPELVSWRAERSPDAVAFECEADGISFTYSEWLAPASSLASRLRQVGVGPGAVVGLYTGRGCTMPIGLLGIQLAGAAYLALEPALPPARLAFMLGDAEASAIVVASALASSPGYLALSDELGRSHAVSATQRESLRVLPLGAEMTSTESAAPFALEQYGESDLAYVMYTSGSTGLPKGVQITQGCISNLLESARDTMGLGEGGTLVGVSSFGFDNSVVDFWMPSLLGASVVIGAEETPADPQRLAALIDRCGATFMQATATAWRLLVGSGWKGCQRLVGVSSGEPMDDALAAAVLELTAEFWNGYGPTETTVWTSAGRVVAGEPLNIGRPFHNTQYYVLDPSMKPVAIGVTGELWIGGSQVAAGYANRPEETASRFVPDPFRGSGRMYRSGDRMRYLPDGRLQPAGRTDNQVKLRGHRIELGEVEACLSGHAGVRAAAVLLVDLGASGPALVAFVMPGAEVPSERVLRDFLRQRLPAYMVPSDFVVRSSLPTTVNGKLDRKRLAAIADSELAEKESAGSSTAAPARDGSSTGHGGPFASGAQVGSGSLLAATETPLEHELIDIWRKLLRLSDLTMDDDFFEVGGHSLLGVMLIDEVRERLGVEIPVSALYQRGATVRGMAMTIQDFRLAVAASDAADREALGLLQPDLHFVVPTDMALVGMRHIAPAISQHLNLNGLLAGRRGETFDRSKSVEDRAAQLVESLLASSAVPPFYIGGWSLGGLIAYEMAAQLRSRGEQIAWLGLVNTPYPPGSAHRSVPPARVARAVLRGPGAMTREGRRQLPKLSRSSQLPTGEFDGEGARVISLGYVPPPIDIPVDLFISEADAIYFGRWLGWPRSRSFNVRRHPVPGEHRAFRDQEAARALGEAMAESLDGLRWSGGSA